MLTATAVFFFCQCIMAQKFVTPLTSLTGKAQVETMDGRTIHGTITESNVGFKGLTSIKIKDSATKESTKFKAEELKSLKVKMDLSAKAETIEKQTGSLFSMLHANSKETSQREYIYYNSVAFPEKADKILLLELLNEGFDSKIKVYENSAEIKSSTSMFGLQLKDGEAKTYIIVVNGVSSFVKKSSFKEKYFDKLFAGCPALASMTEKQVDFNDFAKYVYQFDKNCN